MWYGVIPAAEGLLTRYEAAMERHQAPIRGGGGLEGSGDGDRSGRKARTGLEKCYYTCDRIEKPSDDE